MNVKLFRKLKSYLLGTSSYCLCIFCIWIYMDIFVYSYYSWCNTNFVNNMVHYIYKCLQKKLFHYKRNILFIKKFRYNTRSGLFEIQRIFVSNQRTCIYNVYCLLYMEYINIILHYQAPGRHIRLLRISTSHIYTEILQFTRVE